MLTANLLSPYGLDGFIKALFFSGKADHIKKGDVLTLVLQSGNEVKLTVESIKEATNPKFNAYIRFEGYDVKEKASSLSNAKIYIERSKAHPLNEGEVYTSDLQDMAVIFDGKTVGAVDSIIEMSNGVLLEVKRLDGKKFLLPYKDVFVGTVDTENGTLELKNRELLEL